MGIERDGEAGYPTYGRYGEETESRRFCCISHLLSVLWDLASRASVR
jgi:hypothetical protein